jgi:hypothetical protein
MSEYIAILKELGIPVLGVVGMLIIYLVTIKKFKQEVREELKKVSRDVLKTQITNKELPPYARIAAYDEYKHNGGNSWVDVYVQREKLMQDA